MALAMPSGQLVKFLQVYGRYGGALEDGWRTGQIGASVMFWQVGRFDRVSKLLVKNTWSYMESNDVFRTCEAALYQRRAVCFDCLVWLNMRSWDDVVAYCAVPDDGPPRVTKVFKSAAPDLVRLCCEYLMGDEISGILLDRLQDEFPAVATYIEKVHKEMGVASHPH